MTLDIVQTTVKERVVDDFRVRAAFFDHTVQDALSPPHTSTALESATQGHALDRDLSLLILRAAAQGNTQDKRQLWHAYSGRSAWVGMKPDSQAVPPHIQLYCKIMFVLQKYLEQLFDLHIFV